MIENLISLETISIYQFSKLLDLTYEIKEKPKHFKNSLSGCSVAGVFQNPSFLPHVSFQIAVSSLEGQPVVMKYTDILSTDQNLSEVACHCLDQWFYGVFIETRNHYHIVDLENALKIPVVNTYSEAFSPCQALADFFTMKENHKDLTRLKLAFIGNQKNICHSLILASSLAGTFIHIAIPEENRPDHEVIEASKTKGEQTGFQYKITEDPQEAAADADIIYYSYTNSSPSLKTDKKHSILEPLLSCSKKGSLIMTSIPPEKWGINLGQDIPSNRSLIFSQANNRLHIQKAIMVSLIRNKKREI